jgi:outer membrane receptor protein involved in Fe transport
MASDRFGRARGARVCKRATQAVAQEEAATANELDEIVITAQKRAESQQDVPISLAAFGPAGLSG